MAQFLVRNSLNPNKAVKIGITFSKLVNQPEMTGDNIWVVEIGTIEEHINGGKIAPVYLNVISLDTIDTEIAKAVTTIAEQINWATVLEDDSPPQVSYTNITGYYMGIDSSVNIDIKELAPSSGIDINSIKMEVNGIDVTTELLIDGNPYKYSVNWYPRHRIRSTFI